MKVVNTKDDYCRRDLWSTYQDCIWGEVSIDGDEMIITVQCYDGHLSDGSPDTLRWTAVFKGKVKYVGIFRETIKHRWLKFLENEFNKEEEERKQKRMKEIEQSFLRSGLISAD